MKGMPVRWYQCPETERLLYIETNSFEDYPSIFSTHGSREFTRPIEGVTVEVHFGKPVVARVRKCRLVVVKKKRSSEDADETQHQ